jgi:antitoxin MazE
METSIHKWGNSLGIRLPKHLARNKDLKEGSRILVTETQTGLAIEMVKKPSVSLDLLLKGVKDSNLHQEADWGKGVGNEVW